MPCSTPFPARRRSPQAGQTLLELIVACAILLVLATSAMPVARFTVKRRQEAELRSDLREMRNAIDAYKDAADRNLIRVEAGTEGYPPDLQTLVTGVDLAGQATGNTTGAIPGQTGAAAGGFGASGGITAGSGLSSPPSGITSQGITSTGINSSGTSASATRHVRFLRRIPIDPMTGQANWGMRSVQDDPETSSWGGKDVFDVFSQSAGTALDGTHYIDW